jgi:hypothetical protein
MRLIGDLTPFGTVRAVLWLGERYYTMIDDDGVVSLMPAVIVEREPVLDPVRCVRKVCP